MQGDKLYQAAKYYKENLMNRKFLLTAAKKYKIIELTIVFEESNFKHLIGLNKLTDVSETHKPSIALFRDCLNQELTYERLHQSQFFIEMENRIESFDKIRNVLFSKNLMFKSSHGKFNILEADFLLSCYDETTFVHLFLKEGKEGNVKPCTFFPAEQDYYSQNAIRWKVLDVKEIGKKDSFKKVKRRKKVMAK